MAVFPAELVSVGAIITIKLLDLPATAAAAAKFTSAAAAAAGSSSSAPTVVCMYWEKRASSSRPLSCSFYLSPHKPAIAALFLRRIKKPHTQASKAPRSKLCLESKKGNT